MGPPRPPSAGLSAWEDPDAPLPGADLLEYLGKVDSCDSGTSTPRQPGPITGDGNLTQALLIARKAAEAGTSSSGSDAAAAALARGTSSSFKSQSSGGSFRGRGDAKSRQPGRLSRGSTSAGAEPSPPPPEGGGQPLSAATASPSSEGEAAAELQQDSAIATPRSAALPTPRTEAMGTTCDGGEAATESSCFDAAAGGASHAAAAGGEADRLRGLLYSDDEDGDDEEYQDLMTADDDALFGGGAAGSAGAGAAAAAAVRRNGAGGCGAGSSSRSLLRPAGASSSVASGTVRLSVDGDGEADSAVDEPTGASGSSSAETTTSGAAGPEPPSPPPAAAAAEILMASSGSSAREAFSPAVSQSREVSLQPSPSWATGKSDSGAAASAFSAPRTSIRLGGGGAATEALEKVLSERTSTPGSLGSRATAPPQLTPQDAATAVVATGTEPPAAASPLGQMASLGAAVQPHPHPQQQQHPYPYLHHQQHPDHNHHHQHLYLQQYAPHRSIPTPQIGEGLRQHPPQARRLYTPGQTSRSPIRGSGYVVSPAAMRAPDGASSVSPGRGVHSAVHHHQHQHQQHHQTAGRRASSPSVPLGSSRPRSPLSARPGLQPDGGDEAAASGAAALYGFGAAAGSGGATAAAVGGAPGLLNGGVLRTGSWVGPAAAGNGGGGTAGPGGGSGGPGSGSGGGGHNLTTVSRFPPAQVQNFPGGQVYRSTPISQVPGNPSDELQGMRSLEGPGGGGAAAAAAVAAGGVMGAAGGAGGGGLGPAGAGRSSGSPGRMSARGGRQSRGPGPATPGGPAGPAATPYAQDRFGSFSAPARPSTSPHKSRASVGGGGGRSSAFAGVGGGGGGISPVSAAAVFGGGVLSAPSAVETGDAPAAALPPRGVGVPALPSYTVSVGIRHGAFKQAGGGGPGGGGGGGVGGFGSPFSTGRQKAGAGGASSYPLLHMPPQLSPRGADGSFPAVADGVVTDAAESSLQYPQLSAHAQVQRKHSLPHLLASSPSSSSPSGNQNQNQQELQLGSSGGTSTPNHTTNHMHHPGAHHPQQPHQAAGPGGLYGRGASRLSAAYESGLPAVQASAVRSFSFDMSRRATSRA